MIKNIIYGFIIGIAKIIPGVSGSTLAISLGIYEKILNIIANIKKTKLPDIIFLFNLFIGILIAIITFSNIIKYFINNYYFPTMSLFIGLIIGGLKPFIKSITKLNIPSFIIALFIVILSSNFLNITINTNIITYFFLGIIETLSSIIPGISGTAIYMSLGCYNDVLNIFSLNTDYKYIISFLLGILLSILIVSKTIIKLLNKDRNKVYSAILGFTISSILTMLVLTFQKLTPFNLITGIITFIIGYKLISGLNN